MIETPVSLSNAMTLDEVLDRLSQAHDVVGLALFGSRLNADASPISDYDLLILVENPPVRIFQMLSHIDGRMADIVFAEVDSVKQLLASDSPEQAERRVGYLIQKMLKAQIVYDPSCFLADVRRLALGLVDEGRWPPPTSDSNLYEIWFWQNFALLHIKRLVRSDDPIYQTATDMMLLNALAGMCRAYFQARSLPWEGEKAAIRRLMAIDPDFLEGFRACVTEPDRQEKARQLGGLVEHTIAPLGDRWSRGESGVILADPSEQPMRVVNALDYWAHLLANDQ